ncbi:MAG TPA: FTR1 family protein [Gemmatimonadales bacterium]|jgi:high-affinity iron transporter|nr:FTR1 family protein [Gemmatimonadales bacterium]
MIFIAAWSALTGLALLGSLPFPPGGPAVGDQAPVVRRLAATARLAAQEYAIGVSNGRVVMAAEVEEARLFLTEARRTAELLPPDLSRPTALALDSILALVASTAPPDSVSARVERLTSSLAQRLGIALDEIPTQVPTLARGAEVYRSECAACHGATGRGDGPAAAGLDPPPADLSDFRGLLDRSPLDFYQKVTIGVAGTAMPAYETRLPVADRWAVAAYASLLRLPPPRGDVPSGLRDFTTTARLSDRAVAAALAPGADPGAPDVRGQIAAVRGFQTTTAAGAVASRVFSRVREQLDSTLFLAKSGRGPAASSLAFDAYMTFEQVEHEVRARNPVLAANLEAGFAALRTRTAGGAMAGELDGIRRSLLADLENAERLIADRLPPFNLFVQSFVILLREGLEAILVIGALVAFLIKTGAGHRRRDLHIGIGAAVLASLLTAVLLETIFRVSAAEREALEGITMLVATAMLFYVSYWLLSKMEVAKWNRFVRGRVQDAVSSGSALALASVAFLAVYREGFETVLFYKALFLAGGSGSAWPVLLGMVLGAVALALVYLAINRFGVRIPLKPFFGVTSAFLYYMAFVFAGQGVAELQEGRLVGATILEGAPRIPALGIYPTVESLALQGLLLVLLVVGLVWTFGIEPRRLRVTSELVPEAGPAPAAPEAGLPLEPPVRLEQEMLRSLERMDADLAELRAEVERLKTALLRSAKRERA